MYVYLHILSFKFETKIKIEGRTDGEENAEAGKRMKERGAYQGKKYRDSEKRIIFADDKLTTE